MKPLPKHFRELYRVFTTIRSSKEAEKYLKDILTPQELESLALRFQIVKCLASGMPHRNIAKKLGISISKVTRGSRALQYGVGGFPLMLKRL